PPGKSTSNLLFKWVYKCVSFNCAPESIFSFLFFGGAERRLTQGRQNRPTHSLEQPSTSSTELSSVRRSQVLGHSWTVAVPVLGSSTQYSSSPVQASIPETGPNSSGVESSSRTKLSFHPARGQSS